MPDNVTLSNQATPTDGQPPPDSDSSIPSLIPCSEWKNIWPGSTLDWSSARIPIQLYVELPFWLMMPEGAFHTQYEEANLKISVVHGCNEIQRTTMHHKNHATTVFIARPSEAIPVSIQQLVEQGKSGCSARIHRTTLIIETALHESVLKCSMGSDLEREHARVYLSAMAVGHLPLVNTLITAYRRASNDPFVQEVTEATVPIWFARYQDRFLRVSLYPYADLEYRFDYKTRQGTHEPVNFATSEELREFLAFKETPGETILLDSWSYFYAGRFSDSIRGLVSALEVLLEAKYSEAMKQHGDSDETAQAALKATATKFTTRLNNYLQLTKRTVPGPLLSCTPYITGVRLCEELNRTRELRHRIVHEGHQMSPNEHGPMLRAAETMTWLFDWLEHNERSSRHRFRAYQIKVLLKGMTQFRVEYVPDGVKVLEDKGVPTTQDTAQYMADAQLWGKHRRALYGDKKDLALFAKMSLACILADSTDIMQVFMGDFSVSIEDHDIVKPIPGVMPERFRCYIDGVITAVFLIELDGELADTDLSGVMVHLMQLRLEFSGKRVHGICIVNHQQHLVAARREAYRKLNDHLNALLASCDLSLVLASDLARYINAACEHSWPLTPVRNRMKESGYVPCWPPNSTYAAEVVRVFPKLQVLGVNVDGAPALKEGDQVFVRSATGFELTTIGSIQVDDKPVKSVSKGLAGLKIASDVRQVTEGAFVFLFERPQADPCIGDEA